MDPNQPETPQEPAVDYRTATPEDVKAEQDRLVREPQPQPTGPDYSGVDWQGISREEFRAELAKRGIHIRRGH